MAESSGRRDHPPLFLRHQGIVTGFLGKACYG